jgi:microcin C transport system permease protein
LLLVLFAGGSYFDWFPLRGLLSEGLEADACAPLDWVGFAGGFPFRLNGGFQPGHCLTVVAPDYFWHLALPLLSLVLASFATTALLTKNSFLDEIRKQYVITARAKGLNERQVLYGHVFRNAMLIVVAGFPGAFISAFFTGSLLIENIFSLDGLGLLGFEAAFARDYPLMFGTLYFFSLVGLLLNLVGDLMYTIVDPRIDFEARRV